MTGPLRACALLRELGMDATAIIALEDAGVVAQSSSK
jgi:hypothetical protein